MFAVKTIKKDFPIFKHQPDLVYLDSTATSLKPQSVIDAIVEYYETYSANVARGLYKISEKATQEYEKTREVVARFINAKSADEVIFTRSTTESINLAVYALGREIVKSEDEVVISVMEHHSNFVPWQQLCFEIGADFKVIDIDESYQLQVASCRKEIDLNNVVTKKTKILSLTYVSNVLGTINPIKEIVAVAKRINPNIIIIVDAAQAAPHMIVDVQDLGCDFLTFSSHKMLGPTGVGVLWGRREILNSMFPFNYGGDMIEEVYIKKTIFKPPPHKFEAGTPNIDGVIALKHAIRYLQNLGMNKVHEHEKELVSYGLRRLQETFGEKIRILGPKNVNKGGVIAFVLEKCHPHDIAQILDSDQIAIRAGHHCAMPLHSRLGIGASSRASFYIYNDEDDVEKLVGALKKAMKILS